MADKTEHKPAPMPQPQVAAIAVAPTGSAATEGAPGARRKRRRRGGRGRSRREGSQASMPIKAEAGAKRSETREPKPVRDRVARSEAAEPSRVGVALEPATRARPGLFQRIARFFSPR